MKAHVLQSVEGVEEPGDDVLSGVALHPGKTHLPVDLPPHAGTHGQRTVRVVPDRVLHLLGVGDGQGLSLRRVQASNIAELSAPLRKETGSVQGDPPSALPLLTG